MNDDQIENYVALEVAAEWLRPYQKRYVMCGDRFTSYNKSRRIGISKADALQAVLVAADIHPTIYANNSNVVANTKDKAQDFIKYCEFWVDCLSEDKKIRRHLNLKYSNQSSITFAKTGYQIQAQAQSPNAARGGIGGHLRMDESAHYPYYEKIETGAVPSVMSDDRLTIRRLSTPNGTSGQGSIHHQIHRGAMGDIYTLFETDIFSAVAQGMPVDPELIRSLCATENIWKQEYCCSFLQGDMEYHSLELLRSATELRPDTPHKVYVGIDVASVVDKTAIYVVRKYDHMCWLTECYVLDTMPYESGPHGVGQDEVIAAILRTITPFPTRIVFDATGEGAKLGIHLGRTFPNCPISPHIFTVQFKDHWVPEMKGALERGTLRIDPAPSSEINHARMNRFLDGSIKITNAEGFVENCFVRHDEPAIYGDARRVYKKQNEHKVVFATRRDSGGHGDSYWAALLGFVAASGTVPETKKVKETFRRQKKRASGYRDYM